MPMGNGGQWTIANLDVFRLINLNGRQALWETATKDKLDWLFTNYH
jgi:hypothetical protein